MRARATCPLDCPDACSLLLTLEEGRLLRVEGDPRHPITQGFACAKTYRYPERVRERLLYPLRRVGRKGEGKFVRVSWEEALDEIAKRPDMIITGRAVGIGHGHSNDRFVKILVTKTYGPQHGSRSCTLNPLPSILTTSNLFATTFHKLPYLVSVYLLPFTNNQEF